MNLRRCWGALVGSLYSVLPFPILRAIRLVPFKGKQLGVNRMRPLRQTAGVENQGLKYEVDLHNDVDRSIFFQTAYEEVLDLTSRVQPGDSVFDVGANVGKVTMPLGEKVGNKGKVYAFEPDAGNLSRLRKNRELNQVEARVESIPQAVADEAG